MGAVVVTTIALTAGAAFAWHPDPSSDGNCDTNTGVYSAVLVLTNPVADWNKEPWKMVVLNDTLGVFVQGTKVAIGDSINSKAITIEGPVGTKVETSVLVGWTNGKRTIEDNKRYIASHTKQENCVVPIIPSINLAVESLNCEDRDGNATINTGDGNRPTQVQLVALPDTVLFDGQLEPNSSQVVGPISVAVGQSVMLQLIQGKEVVDEKTMTSPSEAECHVPVPLAVFHGQPNCLDRLDGILVIDRDGLEGNFRVVIEGQIHSIVEGDELVLKSLAQPVDIKLFDPNGNEVPIDLAIVGNPDECPVPPTTPPTTPPTPEGQLPVTGSSTLPLAMVGIAATLIGIGTHNLRRRVTV
ncbi:MAG: hypothetical protein AAB459_03145 [Patescibacteria group bacterium]